MSTYVLHGQICGLLGNFKIKQQRFKRTFYYSMIILIFDVLLRSSKAYRVTIGLSTPKKARVGAGAVRGPVSHFPHAAGSPIIMSGT